MTGVEGVVPPPLEGEDEPDCELEDEVEDGDGVEVLDTVTTLLGFAEGSGAKGLWAPLWCWKRAPSVVSATAESGLLGAWLTGSAGPVAVRLAGATAATGAVVALDPPPPSTA